MASKFKLKILQMNEQQIQMALVHWLGLIKVPVLHIPNEGKRSVAMAIWLKSMGLWPGASDLFITRPKNGYGGYWIEVKSPGKVPKPNQLHFLSIMNKEGYKSDWFDDFDIAKKAIEKYLGL